MIFKACVLLLSLNILASCASTSSRVRLQLKEKALVGHWQAVPANGWLDISCQGEVNLRTADAEMEDGIIAELGKGYFVTEPSPYNDQFNFKTLINKNTGEKQQVITVHSVPDSNILKVVQAFSTLIGDDNTIVFKKTENYICQ